MPPAPRRSRPSPRLAIALAAALVWACAGEGLPLSLEEEASLWEDAHVRGKDPSADSGGCDGYGIGDRGPFGGRVALTFDDGPSAATTPQVVEVLRRHEVPATFFVTGLALRSPAAQSLARELAADPLFMVGNHSWSHPNMATLDLAEAVRQIEDTDAAIRGLGGDPRYFRFPYGSASCETAAAVRSRGYHVTGWTVDSGDWCFASAPVGECPASVFRYVDDDVRDDMVEYVMRQVRRHDGGVVLFHDVHAYTAGTIETVIQTLIAEGFTFTSLDDAETFPLLNGGDAAPSSCSAGTYPIWTCTNDLSARRRCVDGVLQTEVCPAGCLGQPTGSPDLCADGEPGEPERALVAAEDGLNLREGPGTSYDVLLTMPGGALVEILSGPSNGWYEVAYAGVEGWCSGLYLELL